jgi:uncharacterized protein (DUF2252 family)
VRSSAARKQARARTSRRALGRRAEQARARTSRRALGRLTEVVDGRLRIRRDPPLLEPLRELAEERGSASMVADVEERIRANLEAYPASLPDDRRHLLGRFRLVDIALKVVGVGSVGTRCFVALFEGRDQGDPLVLQVKEATASVLEAHLPPSAYAEHGQRVVEGQRLMQTTSDVFLGWSAYRASFYWRQLHDMKGSADVAAMTPGQLSVYVDLCGRTLAHAHARSGDAVGIAAYLGRKDVFDRAVGEFALTYAAVTARDHAALVAAAEDGALATPTPSPSPTPTPA